MAPVLSIRYPADELDFYRPNRLIRRISRRSYDGRSIIAEHCDSPMIRVMLDLLVEGGLYFTIPLTALAIAAAVLVTWQIAGRLAGKFQSPGYRKRLDMLLHVGLLSFVVGILAQALGLYQMLKSVEQIGSVSPALIAGGLAVSAIAPIFGLIILTVSFIVWITLRDVRT